MDIRRIKDEKRASGCYALFGGRLWAINKRGEDAYDREYAKGDHMFKVKASWIV